MNYRKSQCATVGKIVNETTIDGFLDNAFQIIQPAKGAHRCGLDAIFLAAALPNSASGKLADFGAGCGAAGMAAVQRCSELEADLIEIDPENCALLEQSLALQQNKQITSRLKIIKVDLTIKGESRVASGLLDRNYDHVICNPPYNATNSNQSSPNQNRARAYNLERGMLESWIRTAASVSRPKADLAMIIRPQNLPELLSALERRFGAITILPLQPKQNTPASRLIVCSTKGARSALQILPPFVLHGQNGAFTAEAEEVLRGRAGLPF